MRFTSLRGPALAAVCALTAWSCEGVSPASPSALTSAHGPAVRPFDEAPAPVTSVINIVGSSGDVAFLPNPIQAAAGNMVVWMNDDVRLHHIVLDNGTDVGDVMPGQASAPMPLSTAEPVGYHCTLHPSMVGSINGVVAAPAPEPPYYPPYEPDPYY